MGNLVALCMMLIFTVVVGLIIFAVFMIGFLIGYKCEEKRILKKKQQTEKQELNDNEKRSQKEWKKFLEYDGSVPYRQN